MERLWDNNAYLLFEKKSLGNNNSNKQFLIYSMKISYVFLFEIPKIIESAFIEFINDNN